MISNEGTATVAGDAAVVAVDEEQEGQDADDKTKLDGEPARGGGRSRGQPALQQREHGRQG